MAAVRYEMMVFTSEEDEAIAELLLKKSQCYKALGDFMESTKVLERTSSQISSELRLKVRYEKALVYYLNGQFQASYGELLRLKLVGQKLPEAYTHLEVLNLFAQGKWEDAKVLLGSDSFKLNEAEIDDIFAGRIKYKNPNMAYKLSLFLPGVGQAYSGYFFKGIVSATAQSALVGFSAYSLYSGYFWTGGMSGVALFYTFYLGGARYAKSLAIQHNDEIAQLLSKRYLDHIK